MLPANPLRIGVLKTRGLGDAILSSVLTKGIRRRWPDAKIIYFADENTKGMAPLLPAVDEIVEISAVRFWKSIKPLREARLDLLFELGAWSRMDALLAAIANTGYSIGFKSEGQFRHYAYDATVEHRPDIHAAENYISLLTAAGQSYDKSELAPSLEPTNTLKEVKDRLPALDFDKPFLVFHPWAGGSNPKHREWPEENWVELGQRLLKDEFVIAVSGGPLDEAKSQSLCDRIGANAEPNRVVCLAGVTRLKDMYWVLREPNAVVSVNTGTMHMAAAIGVKTIGLHGPTNVTRWGPLGARTIAIAPEDPACGFLNHGFEYKGNPTDCMEKITVDSVYNAIRSG